MALLYKESVLKQSARMYRSLSFTERDTLFSNTVFRIWFSDFILLLIARYGFAVTSVDLYSLCVNNFWAAFVTPFHRQLSITWNKTKAGQPRVSGEFLFQHAKKKVIGSRGKKLYM